jgi:spermidine/putrescine transport system permease protein
MGPFFHRHRRVTPYLLLAPGVLWLAIFFLIPMGFLAYESLQTGLFPHFRFTWAFSNFWDAVSGYHTQLLRSFLYAGIATLACLVLAYPLAYWIAFRAGPWRNLFLLFIVAPFFVTYLVRTLAWQNILADQGPVVGFLRDVHLLGSNGRLLATTFAVVAGITYNFFPFMALPLYVSLEQIDGRLLEAAKDLYASSTKTFLRVTLPLSMPGVVAGTLLTFIPAAGDFINSRLLGNTQTVMIGQVIDAQFLRVLDYPLAAALSFILLILILSLVTFYVRRAGTEELV